MMNTLIVLSFSKLEKWGKFVLSFFKSQIREEGGMSRKIQPKSLNPILCGHTNKRIWGQIKQPISK